jgi:hypothetical protein
MLLVLTGKFSQLYVRICSNLPGLEKHKLRGVARQFLQLAVSVSHHEQFHQADNKQTNFHVMQDDVYVLSQDGWQAGKVLRELIVEKGEKLKETPDLIISSRGVSVVASEA